MSEYYLVECKMSDCLYYLEEDEGGKKRVYCKHPDKATTASTFGCPLYRLDWTKKVKKNTSSLS